MDALSLLTDNFNDNSVDTNKWGDSFDSTATYTEENGKATITLSTTSGDYAAYRTNGSYTLENSHLEVEVPTMCNTAEGNAQMYLQIFADSNNNLEITQFGGTIYFRKTVSGSTTTLASEAYSSTNHRWMRIRESGGTTYWETSTNGSDWTTKASESNPIEPSGLFVDLGGGTFGATTTPGIIEYDNLNIDRFVEESKDLTRKPAHNLLVSWKKETNLDAITFTIGVSTIGGNDIIGIIPGAVGGPGIYKYFNESQYVQSMSWERTLSFPKGGLSMALGEAELGNTSGRFLPDYMGGSSELFTSILPRRPVIFNAGFNFDGIDQTLPQLSGILNRPPQQNIRDKRVQLSVADYTDFFSNRYLDNEIMFTAKRTDEVYEQLLLSMGLSTAQYELDIGLNDIPFGLFEKGTKYLDIFHDLAEAENGQFFQNEEGKFKFENRQHWDSSPHTEVQEIINTAQVIDVEAPDYDHIVNVVEIKSDLYKKQPEREIYRLSAPVELAASTTTEFFIDFDNPALEVNAPTVYSVNSQDDGEGSDLTSNVTLTRIAPFAKAAKLEFTNSGASGYLTSMIVTGRPAENVGQLYERQKNGISVTAYEERPLTIENPYIQNESWALSYSLMVLQDFAQPDKIQQLTIRAMPYLKNGALISWQGSTWRIFGNKTKFDPSIGFVQDLLIFKRAIRSFFRIGISTIGSIDGIAG